jgi:FKBP-type peptidyl-prolyl cis-trans isomerase 2
MNRVSEESLVDMVIQLKWDSGDTAHTEMYLGNKINMWRDRLPPILKSAVMGKQAGDQIHLEFEPGEVTPDFDSKQVQRLKTKQFDLRNSNLGQSGPREGRFYPKGLLQGVPGIFKGNLQPFRCVEARNGHIEVDLNHPMAGNPVSLDVTIGGVAPKNGELGGTSVDWIEKIAEGPGMQARWRGKRSDYFSDNPYSRSDGTPDSGFYRKPRFVDHLDRTALGLVSEVHGRLLENDMEVLDLMSSWHSHLPENLKFNRVAGLGMNREELGRNDLLQERVVHDLNENPELPFGHESYDAVTCTASVEYLIHPEVVFREIGRILRPGGFCIVTFSNRWFPPKAIRVWQEIHEFERMGLVLEYFRSADCFGDLQTYSARGLPRPSDDKYYPQQPYSDPVYAVWGRKK